MRSRNGSLPRAVAERGHGDGQRSCDDPTRRSSTLSMSHAPPGPQQQAWAMHYLCRTDGSGGRSRRGRQDACPNHASSGSTRETASYARGRKVRLPDASAGTGQEFGEVSDLRDAARADLEPSRTNDRAGPSTAADRLHCRTLLGVAAPAILRFDEGRRAKRSWASARLRCGRSPKCRRHRSRPRRRVCRGFRRRGCAR